ncbi:MAG: hypothetical protein IKC91_00575 [Clostridia bacterium]|nr:hypothetical protein [Clostridia bacterium]
MLNLKERRIMNAVYELCEGAGSCLCAPWDILARIEKKQRFDEATLEKILHDLQSDGYLDLIRSERKGDPVYVITLRANGYAYQRQNLFFKRNFYLKIAWTVGGAVLSFLIGLLLRSFFS